MSVESLAHAISKDDGIGRDEVNETGAICFTPRSATSIPKKPNDIAKRITKLLEEGKQHFAENEVSSKLTEIVEGDMAIG